MHSHLITFYIHGDSFVNKPWQKPGPGTGHATKNGLECQLESQHPRAHSGHPESPDTMKKQ